ncbi:hypothetical protein MIMGU_mgv1a008047mg [Erythranthe guttata]|uniref:Uncharacterized protein n=1 Tax=Erythranthe guttata TaxID=4155 RepID=A0A022Q6Z5_ERYGU|nr:hypothetical protein MIMGU_mgv1a008047mg [Erythranthe guttata]
MARGGKKEVTSAAAAADPEAEERLRLKRVAFSRNILSQNPVKVGHTTALAPSITVIKHHGKDILRKSQRKNKYLFSFPGLLGPISGGKIGELKDLGTKNPILYLDFPQEKFTGYDFKGGVGATSDGKQGSEKSALKSVERVLPKVYLEEDISDSPRDYEKLTEVTPTRQSTRTAGKTFNFAEPSSGDDIIGTEDETPEEEDTKIDTETRKKYAPTDTESSPHIVFDVDNEDNARGSPSLGQYKLTGNTKDPSGNGRTSLVQTTLSSLFKKVEEKKATDVKQTVTTSEASNLMKGRRKTKGEESGTVTKRQKKDSEKELVESINQRNSKRKTSGPSTSTRGEVDLVDLVPASQSIASNDSTQVEDDDIEEFSNTSQDLDESDEDWTG